MNITCETDGYGNKKWFNSKGEYHREDGPACEYCSGDKHWYINDERHREDGPAIELDNGDKWWYLNGKSYTQTKWLTIIRKIKLAKL